MLFPSEFTIQHSEFFTPTLAQKRREDGDKAEQSPLMQIKIQPLKHKDRKQQNTD